MIDDQENNAQKDQDDIVMDTGDEDPE